MKQYLYIINSDSGLCKVGISMSPEIRRKYLESASGHKTSIFKVFGPFNAARKLECTVHKALDHCRAEGEWFGCSASHAAGVVECFVEKFIDEIDEDPSIELARLSEFKKFSEAFLGANGEREKEEFWLSKFEELIDRNAKLSEEIFEAAELVDYYAEAAKETMLIARKAMDQVVRLERQLARARQEEVAT